MAGGKLPETRLRDWLPGLAATSLLLFGARERLLATVRLRVAITWMVSFEPGFASAALAWAGAVSGSLHCAASAVTMAGQGHTSNAARGGWPRAAFEFWGGVVAFDSDRRTLPAIDLRLLFA